jgi:hypothetical protein
MLIIHLDEVLSGNFRSVQSSINVMRLIYGLMGPFCYNNFNQFMDWLVSFRQSLFTYNDPLKPQKMRRWVPTDEKAEPSNDEGITVGPLGPMGRYLRFSYRVFHRCCSHPRLRRIYSVSVYRLGPLRRAPTIYPDLCAVGSRPHSASRRLFEPDVGKETFKRLRLSRPPESRLSAECESPGAITDRDADSHSF